MKIRRRAILVIILTNMVIVMFSVSTGILFVKTTMDLSIEADLAIMANIADHFLSIELENLKLKGRGAAQSLDTGIEANWSEILSGQIVLYPEFTGMAVIDSSGELIAASGKTTATPDIINEKSIRQAFPSVHGRNVISSTCQTANGVVFYLAFPLLSHDNILVLTLPGTYFARRLSDSVIWETGHIFMSDSEGFTVSNPRDHWLQSRFNYIQIAQTDSTYTDLAKTVTRMTQGETGVGYYSVEGIPRVCSFRPISGSEEGWSLGVVAPLPESPARNMDRGLLIVAVISIILNVIAAIIASNFIKKPFERIEVLKEEADNANKAKSTFLSTMSHEIRTPMNVILGISEIQLQKESIDPSVKEAFVKIFTSGDLLLSIINDILDLSKIEAGKLEILIDEYEVASMINDTTQLNMMRIGSKLIMFELDIDENIPTHLLGDELRIKQIFNNLLSNAFKYTEQGNVTLSIYTEKSANDNEIILVCIVKDTGQGMTEEQVSKLFDEYSRFNQQANRLKEGTGLGMSITHKLVSLMNGSIQIESEPGKGSVFTVRLPQGKCPTLLNNAPVILGKELAENLSKFRMYDSNHLNKIKIKREPMPYGSVLIVDDVEANIYVAKGLLSLYEIKIDSAGSGPGAIDKIKKGEVYDIIFMDHMMPGMDGMEATKHIRDLGYTAPIIALSANVFDGQTDIFRQNGFDDFISKPIDLRYLDVLLDKFIRDKQPQEVIDKANRKNGIHIQELNFTEPQPDSSESILRDVAISGLDMGKGIRRFDGNHKAYLDILRSYAVSIKSMIEKIETVSEDSLTNYIISVHGIKGTSFDIFAESVAKGAEKLEKAGKSGDMEYIRENNPAFLENARTLISAIEEALANLNTGSEKPLRDKPDIKILLQLMNACNEYDMGGADNAMAELEENTYESDNDLIGWLRDRVDRMQFEEIVTRLTATLQEES